MGREPPAFTMSGDRKCILCETVCFSKQEMVQHIRSMLHHRELETLKGRDCGHDCRVCKVKVVSLAEYASHLSSASHKQNVEAADQTPAGSNGDEDYLDQALVDLIEKRKEQIRKDKEAAAAKLEREQEEQRRKEAFQQRLREAKDQYRREVDWHHPSEMYGEHTFDHHNSWYNNNQYYGQPREMPPWHSYKQGKSATWHAQEPPNFQNWESEDFADRRMNTQECRSNRTWGQGSFFRGQPNRHPWLSNAGSSNGLYGRNTIGQYDQRRPPPKFFDPRSIHPPPLPSFSQSNHFQNPGNDQRSQHDTGFHNGEGQSTEFDHSSSKSSKTFGSNPKLDKACRWSPYPVTKGSESVHQNDTNPNSSEKSSKVPKPQRPDKPPETSSFNRQSRPEQKAPMISRKQSLEDLKKPQTNLPTKPRDRSSSSNRSSSSQKDGPKIFPSSDQKANRPLQKSEHKVSPIPDVSSVAQLGENSSQAQVLLRPTENRSKLQSLPARLLSRSDRQLLETLRKAKHIVSRKKDTSDNSGPNKMEMTPEEQKSDQVQSPAGMNREKSCRPNAAIPEKPVLPSSDSSQFLQSLQVSTSTLESSEPAASMRDDEENMRKVEKEMCSMSPDEAMQVSEAGQSSSLSKLDLPPVLKRDLTKHISSKSKAIGHEPNLNIARRVRNLSESRRSDSEKDSRLKPNVRQLINSSSSRRNVNWEQVYQEVRKKQDKGKGMPRFGIEVVPHEQENQNLEEDEIPLLEGFHWDSVEDSSSQDTSQKHSLSENCLAPASINSLCSSKERPKNEESSLVQQASVVSSTHKPAPENPKDQRQVEVGQTPVRVKTEKQTDEPTSSAIKALEQFDSMLGDSSSGTEQCDGQGTGKRRRAAVDIPSTESSCLEHNSKRQKVKVKQERSHIDQLLAVSLREEELSRSLQTVDTNLIQARATLEAAYIEVQRLIVVKQQMTGEMGTLRTKRIELLKGMQDSAEEAPTVKLKEEKMDSVQTESNIPSSLALSSAADAAPQSPNQAAECASPPSSSLPFTTIVIKEEPKSPIHIYSESEPVKNIGISAHSTTPDLPFPQTTASVPDPAPSFQPPPKSPPVPELYKIKVEEPDNWKEYIHETSELMEKVTETEYHGPTPVPNSKTGPKRLSPSRRGSDAAECGEVALFQAPAVPLNVPASPFDLTPGKRVRKLKKRKSLKKSPGAEQPETSDTEMDEGVTRPRWPRSRRRPSGGSQVSSSSLPTEEGEANAEGSKKTARQQLLIKLERVDQKHLDKMVELPQVVPVVPVDPVAPLDSEESMELTAASQQPANLEVPSPSAVPEPSKCEPQSLAACMSMNEVSSTSDMDLCRSSESDMPFAITYPKNSSDAFSDHGEDELPTEGVFEGHQESVNAMQIHDGLLYTCSGDRTVKVFDLVSHKCVGVFEGHSSKVNCLLVSVAPSLHHRLYSGSSDQTIRCYSLKTRELEQQFSLSDRVLCLHSRWRTLYAGLANGTVVTFNLKSNKQMDVFECHAPRAVSCLASSQEGPRRILLVGSYDNTISVRDAKTGVPLRLLEGHSKTVLCMKVVNDVVYSGSSDQCVFAHNIHTGEQVRVYNGHSHAVTVVAVLGKVMVTACLDKLVRVYDLQSHEQLQVYSGHKDMVMCLAVHKNLIYTGCYDGSVQAVKLNLMQNHRCWWHGCSLVFGVTEHLKQHLIKDHTSANSQTLKCRWKHCEEFFCSRNSSMQGMLLHMQKHAEEETEVEPYLQ